MFEVISAGKAEDGYRLSEDFGFPYPGRRVEEVRRFVGDLDLRDDLVSDFVDHPVHHVVVDGDLTVHGDLDWSTDGFGVFFLVTGALRARNVLLHGGPEMAVRGGLDVRGAVFGAHHGPGAGFLRVHGPARFRLAVATADFHLDFRSSADGPVAVAAGATVRGVPDPMAAETLLDPALLDRNAHPLGHEIADALSTGRSLFA